MKVRDYSFLNLVYPFMFDSDSFAQREKTIEIATWKGAKQELKIWNGHSYPVGDLLPHVSRYLNAKQGIPTCRAWDMSGETLQTHRGIGSKGQWTLIFDKGASAHRAELDFHIDGLQLVLFPIGIGFLNITLFPRTDSVEDWSYFVYHARFTDRPRSVSIRARRPTGPGSISPFWPEQAGGLARHPDGEGVLKEIVDAVLGTGRLPSDTEEWWKEVYIARQLLPFASIFIDDPTDHEIPDTLYMFRHFFHQGQERNLTDEDMAMTHPALLPYAKKQWFVFSVDGGAFIGFDCPRSAFYTSTLPDHLRNHYFLIFMLALNQRFFLINLSERAAASWLLPNVRERMKKFEAMRNVFLEFLARDYFSQVMQSENHHRSYRRWQEVLQIEHFCAEVRYEINEMHNTLTEYLAKQADRRFKRQEAQTRNLELMLVGLGSFVGFPMLALTLLLAVHDVRSGTAIAALGGGILSGLLVFLVVREMSRRRSSSLKDSEE